AGASARGARRFGCTGFRGFRHRTEYGVPTVMREGPPRPVGAGPTCADAGACYVLQAGFRFRRRAMMRVLTSTLAAATAVVLTAVSLVPDAEARITCRDGFQATRDGGWISTPYCNDEDLAHLGRRHGMKVTGARLRRDWSKREEVCRLVGHTGKGRHY